jgi:hypothetical protein
MSDLIKRVILTEMITLYRAPSQVQNAEQGAVFQTAIIETLAQFNPTEPELRRIWTEFKKTWTKTTWPTPGDLCQALSKHRRDNGHKFPRPSGPPVEEDRPMTAAEEAEFRHVVAKLRANPEQYFASKALLKMAEHFEKRDR